MRGAVCVAVTIALSAAAARADEPRMVEISGGTFKIGCQKGRYCAFGAARRVRVGRFRIDATEVTNAAYRECVEAGACEEPVKHWPSWTETEVRDHPVVGVSWKQARDYCAWRKKRLPTEAEWERAARGPGEQVWPWGDAAPSCDLAYTLGCVEWSFDKLYTRPVGSLHDGDSPEGVTDMVGGAGEWVADVYRPISKRARRRVSRDRGRACRGERRCARRRHVMKGLPLAHATPPIAPSARWPAKPAYYFFMGFRCAADAE